MNFNDELDAVFFEGLLYAMQGDNPSKAIENQERRGTIRAAREGKLPKKTNHVAIPYDVLWEGTNDKMDWDTKHKISEENNIRWTKQQYEMMGFKIIDDYDDLFFTVDVPAGWKINPTDHSMWNEVIDDKGRKRISYFYKAAFYDRDAFSNFLHRYNYSIEPFDNYESDASYEDRKFKPWTLYITDAGEIIETVYSITPTTQEEFLNVQDKLRKMGQDYLNENYPNWEEIHAYWGR